MTPASAATDVQTGGAPPPRRGGASRASGARAIALLLGLLVCPTAWAAADSTRVRFEAGWRTDASNEFYYEQMFDDTTFRPAQLQSTPEVLHALVARLEWARPESPYRDRWRVGLDARAGERLQSVAADARRQWTRAGGWDVTVAPLASWQFDGTFDRARREARAAASVQARHPFGARPARWGLRGAADLLRSSGAGSEYVLDRDLASCGVFVDRSAVDGPQWRADVGLDLRQFPDSSTRDHSEIAGDATFRHDGDGFAIEATGRIARRDTRHVVASSRDRFRAADVGLECRLRTASLWSGIARLEGELLSYDDPDSSLWFDYRVVRGAVAARFENGAWSAQCGPRFEWLAAPWNPTESYREPAGAMEIEWLGPGGLWSLSPAVGWRGYDDPLPGQLAAHTSFTFAEAHVILEQGLPGRLRVRGFAYGRIEKHADATQDARSLYLSLDVRRLF